MFRAEGSSETAGLLVDLVIQIPYFRDIADTAGNKTLSKFIPLLEFYVLRDKKSLVSEMDHYVVLDGKVIPTKTEG